MIGRKNRKVCCSFQWINREEIKIVSPVHFQQHHQAQEKHWWRWWRFQSRRLECSRDTLDTVLHSSRDCCYTENNSPPDWCCPFLSDKLRKNGVFVFRESATWCWALLATLDIDSVIENIGLIQQVYKSVSPDLIFEPWVDNDFESH